MIYHMTGGAWGFLIRRILEAASRTLPLVAVGFVPIALGAARLYLWAQPDAVSGNKLLQEQQVYMNLPFWCVRAAVYFGLWLLIAFLLNVLSRREDRAASASVRLWLNTVSGIGLVIYGITIHFASVDWIISLQPAYHSTITGPMLAAQQLLCAMSLAVIVFTSLCRLKPIADVVSPKTLNDLGNLLLTFVVLWAYMWWFEFMLIWIGNLPPDLIWYVNRVRGGWLWVCLALVIFNFAAPFLLLLQRQVKQQPVMLAHVAGVVLFMQLVFTHWQILPAFQPTGVGECWVCLFAPFALGGLWGAYFLWQFRRWPLLAQHDNNARAAERLRINDEFEREWEESLAHG